jgi:hypothetical protein
MAREPIPDDVREFILGHIDSIAQLEALLLLRRNPSTTWNAHSVACVSTSVKAKRLSSSQD